MGWMIGGLLVLHGLAMFIAGMLVEEAKRPERDMEQWLDGFRDGWEAAEQFDNDVRVVWGGR